MEEFLYMYHFELFVIVAALVILGIALYYAKFKMEELKKKDGAFYQDNPEYKKIAKFPKQAKMIVFPIIALAILSMIYYTVHEPPIEEQEKAYKEWALEVMKNYEAYVNARGMMIASVNVSLNGKEYCIAAQKLVEKEPERFIPLTNSVKYLPRGVSYDKRKRLAKGAMLVNEGIDDAKEACDYIKESLPLIEKVYDGESADDAIERIKKATKLLEKEKSKTLFGVAHLLVSVAGDFNLKYTNGNFVKVENKEEAKKEMEEDLKKQSSVKDDKPLSTNTTSNTIEKSSISDSNIEKASKELTSYGINGKVVATSYGHSSKGFLVKMNDDKVYLVDTINNRAVQVSPYSAVQHIASYNGGAKQTIRFELTIFNDTKDSDVDNGAWKGNTHILPVTVEHNYENGQHIPYMIKSGAGVSPASYDNFLYERKNVDAVNMIVEEASSLK